jgi:cytochrome c
MRLFRTMVKVSLLFIPLVACSQDVETQSALSASAETGKRMFLFCQSCHSVNEGGANKVGPNLYDVFGKPAAQKEGYTYSKALTAADITWTAEVLDKWIESPGVVVPGTSMIFAGIQNPQQRADLIAYLQESAPSD